MKITSAYERRIRERWETLAPILLMRLKSGHERLASDSIQSVMEGYRVLHRDAVITCMERQISFHRMRLYNLDDPEISEADRGSRIAQFLESRRRHPGRSPSLGRSSNKRPAAILPGDI